MIFALEHAVIISIVWGLVLLTVFSYKVAKIVKKKNILHVVSEHLIIAVTVIIIANYVGVIISNYIKYF